MPTTKVIKPKPVETTRKPAEKTKPVKVKAVNGAGRELQVPAVRNSRASSCPRCPQRDRCERTTTTCTTTTTASKPSCERRRARSISAAPKPTPHWTKTNPDKPPTGSVRHAAVNPKSQETSSGPGRRQQRSVRAETSHKAFTVIPPNPKKRREIQRKAEAELAALEELRLSRAMAYVSINPSSVGGCMSLEEVRLKQQQEMMQAKRNQKPELVETKHRAKIEETLDLDSSDEEAGDGANTCPDELSVTSPLVYAGSSTPHTICNWSKIPYLDKKST